MRANTDFIFALSGKKQTPNGNLARNFVAGAIGGTFATMLNTPFDVVKTRIQNQSTNGVQKYNWTLPGVVTVYREEGYVIMLFCFCGVEGVVVLSKNG